MSSGQQSPTEREQELEPPPISLIIPSRNRPRLLLDAVESVLQGDEVPTELIIVDQSDAPHPDLKEFTTERACAVRYLWTRSVGQSRATNEGIAAATYDIIVLTDDDMVVAPSWLRELVSALVAVGPRGVVTGRVEPGEVTVPGGFAPSTKTADTREVYQGRIKEDILFTNNAAMSRSVTAEVGLFDERLGPGTPFPAAQDNDFGFRLLEAGYRIVYEPSAVAYHRAWRARGDYLPLSWSYGRGQGAFYAKHMSFRDRHMLGRMLKEIARNIFQFIRVVPTHPHTSLGRVVYVGAVLSGAAEWRLSQKTQRAVR